MLADGMAMDVAAMPTAAAPPGMAIGGLGGPPGAMRGASAANSADGSPGAATVPAEAAGRTTASPPVPARTSTTSSPRKNLNETAFFFPHLVSDERRRRCASSSPMPEALTKWKFMAFAHDKDLRSGYLAGRGRHRQGPDGPAQPAAVPPRGRRARVHRQGEQPGRRRGRRARCG